MLVKFGNKMRFCFSYNIYTDCDDVYIKNKFKQFMIDTYKFTEEEFERYINYKMDLLEFETKCESHNRVIEDFFESLPYNYFVGYSDNREQWVVSQFLGRK